VRIGRLEIKRRVWVGSIFDLTAVGVWWTWTSSMKPAAGAAVKSRQPFVRLASAGLSVSDRILRERAEYFDPTPLFFPTEWNFGQSMLPKSLRREPEQVFGSFEPKLPFAEQYLKTQLGEDTPSAERLADILAQGNEQPLGGLGQIDRQSPALETRSGFLEISSLVDGKLIVAQSINDLSLPHLDYKPLEFIAVVGTSGLVGELALVSSSGLDEMDAQLRTYLVKTFRLGERLNPGRYQIVIGP